MLVGGAGNDLINIGIGNDFVFGEGVSAGELAYFDDDLPLL